MSHSSFKIRPVFLALLALGSQAAAEGPLSLPGVALPGAKDVAAAGVADLPRSGGGLGIFGCSASGSKQIIGAAVGTAAGGFLGNRIAGSGSRSVGTLAGAALGGVAGSALGCKLQQNDRAKAERALQQAAATDKAQSWQNGQTGTSGTVEPVAGANGNNLDSMRFAQGVEPVDQYTRIGGAYRVVADSNLRGSPGMNGAVLGKVARGQTIWVPASTASGTWMLVSNRDVGQGYVATSQLRPVATTSSGCKQVKQSISIEGMPPEVEFLEACRNADGTWALKQVS